MDSTSEIPTKQVLAIERQKIFSGKSDQCSRTCVRIAYHKGLCIDNIKFGEIMGAP